MTTAVKLWWAGEEFDILVDVLPPTPDAFGPIASSLNPITASIAGSTNVTGTIAVTSIRPITAALTGLHAAPVTGTVASSLNAITSALAGLHSPAVTGTAAPSLNAITAALAGAHAQGNAVAGGIAPTLNPITAALAGEISIRGDIASGLPAITAALSGNHGTAVVAMVAASLSPMTVLMEGLANATPTPTPPPRTGGGSLRRRFYSTTKTSGTISER